MALTKWDRLGVDIPERWRRWLYMDEEPEGWLRVEEERHDGMLFIRAEIPGIDPEKDLDVSVSDHTLRISAKREEHTEDKKKDAYRSEFRYGEFQRSVPLPAVVDRDSVKAAYKDGILEVTLPWPAEHEPGSTKVPITRAA